MPMREVTIKAYAKINITLDVLGRRPDGYHDLCSVMRSVALYDTLRLRKTDKPGVAFACDGAGLPASEDNLAYRAAAYLLDVYRLPSGVSIALEKRIPIAAGLGGGSSDCAAALSGMNQLFDLRLAPDALRAVGERFGADVPFCLTGGVALAEGVGERLTALPAHPPVWTLLACPDVYVSTAAVFARWRDDNAAPGTPAMTDALRRGDIRRVAACLSNGLSPVTARLHPEVGALAQAMRGLGALNACMSGSGPSVFGYFIHEADARAAYDALRRDGPRLRDIFLIEG